MRISDWSSDVCSSDLTRERDDDEPVEGVSIFVRSAAGEDIDSAEYDADGRWEIEVPDPGSYEVEIDQGSLHDGVTIRNEERTTLPVRSEERRVGKECVSTGRSRWGTDH